MWNLRWISVYQDLDQKREADKNFRDEEITIRHDLLEEIAFGLATVSRDKRAGFALRFYLEFYASKIINKFDVLEHGTRFHWGFVLHAIQALWLFLGSLIVPLLINEWPGFGRLLPTHIRAVGIYAALFLSRGVTNELLMRTTEDQLLSLWIPTTAYLVISLKPEWHGIGLEEWFVWSTVGATSLFVFVVSLRRMLFNGFLKLLIRCKRFDPEYANDIVQVHLRLVLPCNKVLNLIDRHQFVPTYYEMIWEPSRLSVNLSIRNSFLREDIGDLLDCLELCSRNVLPRQDRRERNFDVETVSRAQYPYAPKLFIAILAVLVLAFAIGPFFQFEFVLASAIPWGLRCMLRIGASVFSPNQSSGDVAKIFAVVVAVGFTDFPFSIALFMTDFKAFEDVTLRWVLVALVTVLVMTVSDALAPSMLVLANKAGWVEQPQLLLRPEDPDYWADSVELHDRLLIRL